MYIIRRLTTILVIYLWLILPIAGCGSSSSATTALVFLLLGGTTKELTETPVPAAVKFKATFSSALDSTTRSNVESGFVLKQGDTALEKTFEWASDNASVTVTPSSWFSHNTAYTVGLSASGVQDVAETSFTTAVKGDVNGDGYADVIAGAPEATGGNMQGKAYVFLGSANGVDSCDLATCTPYLSINGPSQISFFGDALSVGGDINADGYADIIIGADGAGDNAEGGVYIFYGPASGISPCDLSSGCTADVTINGDTAAGYLGNAASFAGDVNGDGYDDVIMGASNARKTYVFLGSSTLSSTPSLADADTTISGSADNDVFPTSATTAGDVNGDGYADIIFSDYEWMTAVNRGQAYIFLGSATGIDDCDLSAGCTANTTITGETDGDYFGTSVSTAGDVNGDGYDDVILGAQSYSSSKGRSYILLGSTNGISDCDLSSGCTADTTITGAADNSTLGYSVFTAGDVNADGYADTIVGAPGTDAGGTDKGRTYVFLGSASGIADCDLSATCTADTTITGAADSSALGSSVSTALDVNGDGYDDIVTSAYENAGAGDDRGRVYGLLGSTGGIDDCDLGGSCTPDTTIVGEDDLDHLSYVR